MKETFYFSHDYNASQDPKIMILLSKCGLSGLGMYWILIEILHQQNDSKISYDAYKGYIKFFSSYENRGEHLLNTIEQELISSQLLVKENDFIYSKRVLENKKQRQIISEKRSLAGKKSAEIRYNLTNVEHVFNKGQQGKERKGKEKLILQSTDCSDIPLNGLNELNRQIIEIFNVFGGINPAIREMYGNKTQRKAITDLIALEGFEKIKTAAEFSLEIRDQQYAPVITTPHQLLTKYAQLKIFYRKKYGN